MKPVLEEIKAKKQEARMVKMSRIAVQMQEEKLAQIDKELAVLEKKANEIRKQNMKDFEAILTKDQKKILKNMKKKDVRILNAAITVRLHLHVLKHLIK